MEEYKERFFLAANSTEGFISHFTDCYDQFDGWQVYIIKGGPGTGKSTFMKRVAIAAEKEKIKCIYCPCSSDPDSLDAVIFEDIKVVILDGTAPHIVEPQLPGACENIINLADYWDKEALYKNRCDIISATQKNKQLHKRAARYLSAAGQFLKDNIKLAESGLKKEEVENFSIRLAKRLIPKQSSKRGRLWQRFISGVTPKGIVNFEISDKIYKNKIIIRDEYTVCAPVILKHIENRALTAGYEIIALENPFLKGLTDHILIPELSLAILSENNYIKFDFKERRIHARRFLEVNKLKSVQQKIKFNKKAFENIMETVFATLREAKTSHDVLEEYYINAMDFKKVKAKAEDISKEIKSRV